MGAVLRRHDETLASLLDTMPTTVAGLAAVLQHLAKPNLYDPGEPSLLIAVCTTAMDEELSAAAASYLSRLSAALPPWPRRRSRPCRIGSRLRWQ
jgi:hypothetical protein